MNCPRCGFPHTQGQWDDLFTDWRLFFQNRKGYPMRKAFDTAHREMKKHGPRPDGPPGMPFLARVGLKIVGKGRLMKLLSGMIPGLIKKVAEEEFGKGPAKVYWWFAGKKSLISALLGAAWAMGYFVVIPYLAGQPVGAIDPTTIPQIESWLSTLATVVVPLAVSIGVADASLRLEPPKKKV
jgi:hypothetical protein